GNAWTMQLSGAKGWIEPTLTRVTIATGKTQQDDYWSLAGLPHPSDEKRPALQLELALGFQTAVGVINAQRAMDGAPRLLLETDVYRGVRRLSARHLPELVGAPDDDRLQLAPVLACVGGRVVLATHPEAAQALIDRALDGPATPRATGDALHLRGAPIAEALRLARPFLAARAAVTQEGGAAPDAEIARAAALIERIRGVDVHFAVGAGRARLTAEIDAPALLEPPGTAPR
ncbi:MAG TPA: hypothetical protein VEI02_08880, partial [Planctomycetota bacterium]|nr:hypothetical protein [Planctomycetota bacterium]